MQVVHNKVNLCEFECVIMSLFSLHTSGLIVLLLYKTFVSQLKVKLDEPAGAEKYRSITTMFYRHVDAVILMYSVADQYTFDGLEYIAAVARDKLVTNSEGSTIWALFGNKSDEPVAIEDLEERVEELSRRVTGATELRDLHFLVSAKTGDGVKEALDAVVREVHRRRKAVGSIKRNRGMIVRGPSMDTTADKCCS